MIGQTVNIIAEELYRAPWILKNLIGGLLGGLLVGLGREKRIRKSGKSNPKKASLIGTGILGVKVPIAIFYISLLLFILFLKP